MPKKKLETSKASSESTASSPEDETGKPEISLTELFDIDPNDLSDAQVQSIVVELRKRREEFIADEKSGKNKKRSEQERAEAKTRSQSVGLADIGLD